jgi:hypothetical protein
MIVNDELRKLWKKVLVTYLTVISPYLSDENEEDHTKPQSA